MTGAEEPSSDTVDEPDGDPVADVGQRVGARLVDWLILFVPLPVLIALSSEDTDDGALTYATWAVLVWITLVIVYEAGFVAWRGQTPGKMLFGIELVALSDGTTPTLGQALARVAPVALAVAVLGAFFPVVMVFVYFSAAFTGDTRGLLDRLAGTVVIRARGRD